MKERSEPVITVTVTKLVNRQVCLSCLVFLSIEYLYWYRVLMTASTSFRRWFLWRFFELLCTVQLYVWYSMKKKHYGIWISLQQPYRYEAWTAGISAALGDNVTVRSQRSCFYMVSVENLYKPTYSTPFSCVLLIILRTFFKYVEFTC